MDSLTFDSDYSAFMQPKIAEETKRAALRKLFSDPSFNVMDGLDIYVGDYTQSDPMPSGMLEKLTAAYAMLEPVEPARVEHGRCGRRRGSRRPRRRAPQARRCSKRRVDGTLRPKPVPSAPEAHAGDTSPKSGHA